MSADQWTAVDRYFTDTLIPPDPVLDEVLRSSAAAGLPPISVTPNQGKLLMLLAAACGANRVLEIGTLGGYSTIWLARALPTFGRVITLEADPRCAQVASENFSRAGLSSVIRLRLGRAFDTLPVLAAERPAPFDLIFIDADKASTPEYFAWAIHLSRPGTLIVTDNVVREGELVNAASQDPSVRGMRRFFEMLATETRVAATALQTVGAKGYDGFAIARVVSAS